MADIEIGTDWRKVIQAAAEPVTYFLEISGGDLDIGKEPTADRRQRTKLKDGDRGQLTVPAGENIFAQADSGTVTLTVNRQDTQLTLYPRQSVGTVSGSSFQLEDSDGNTVDPDAYGSSGTNSQVSLGSESQLLSASSSRRNFTVRNYGSDTIFVELSGSTATTGTSLPLDADESYTDEQYQGEVRAVPNSGTQDVRVVEVVA